MKFQSPLIVVTDLEKSKKFYKDVFGLRVILDFGANVTLTGGLALQTLDSWTGFLQKSENEIRFGGNNFELYFEEDDFDGFVEKLNKIDGIEYVNPPYECAWGQRLVRIYDLDKHIIEIGENMDMVCKRFHGSGMTHEEIAKRMDVPIKFIRATLKKFGI